VHFRTELSCEKALNDEYRTVIDSLDQLYQDVSRQIGDLEKALQQIDKYQHDIQLLKQKLVQEEQLLKTMTPEHPESNIQVGGCFDFMTLNTPLSINTITYHMNILFKNILRRVVDLKHFTLFLVFFVTHSQSIYLST
jgi:hypothetical protein